MTTTTTRPPPSQAGRKRKPRTGRALRRTSLSAHGEPLVWLTGGALCVSLFMIVGLLALVFVQGMATFWPLPVVSIETEGGSVVMGEVTRVEPTAEGEGSRRLVRTGNFEISGEHFAWVDDSAVATEVRPEWAVVLERRTWGRFYGTPTAFLIEGEPVAEGPAAAWAAFQQHEPAVRERFEHRRKLEKDDVGDINHALERARLHVKQVGLDTGAGSDEHVAAEAELATLTERLDEDYAQVRAAIDELDEQNARYAMVLQTATGTDVEVPVDQIVRGYPANGLSFAQKAALYVARWWEFLTDEPREANSEGGVWPAIFGTIMMTMIMTVLVVPFGVLAALYLREYAKQGVLVSAVRIAVNNLAGVPSIVFGVFGLGFFCYIVGGGIDQLFFEAKLPSPTFGTGGILWASLTLSLLTLPVVIVATEEALAAVPNSMREGSYACGASKWQTIRRIVLPRAMPGVMTGCILAIARGAGEVAPLMLVGAVKLAPELPFDLHAPFVHLERSFMHLGFHIYDLGFQSQNSEAAKPIVFTTTLLLIGIVVLLDFSAIGIRSRLRRRFVSGRI